MRTFDITWRESKKHSIERTNRINVTNPAGDIGIDAKAALNLFISAFGGLKKNEIISIQEIDVETGAFIGEPIKPVDTDEPVILPYKRK